LLRAHSGDSSIAYYKEQLEKANDTIVNLQKQLKKSSEEMRKIKEDASKMTTKQLIDSNVV
jgi:prefoldin subunit 5